MSKTIEELEAEVEAAKEAYNAACAAYAYADADAAADAYHVDAWRAWNAARDALAKAKGETE